LNSIQKAVSELKFRIPKAILEKTFLTTNKYGMINYSSNVDEQIIRNVIKARVLVDCNMVGGVEELIPLVGLESEKPTPSTTVVMIPKTLTQGKSINSVLNISFLPPNAAAGLSTGMGTSRCPPNPMLQATSAMANALDGIPVVSTARVELINENVILIRDNINLPPNCYLRCILANDDELSNIQLRSYRFFANLVEYATKSYIYNELIINMDQDQLMGGASIGIFKEVVSGYADSEQNYRDYLQDVWEKVAYMNDNAQYSRLTKLIVGGPR
jgi:hypothetical protein